MGSYLKKSIKDEKYYNSIEEWKEVYKPFLRQLYNNDKIAGQYKDPYRDPDSYYTNAKEFYINMVKFLNNRERELQEQNRLKGYFEYSYDEDEKFIKVVEGKETLFYLKTDQLGFSAPSVKQSHPYDTYIKIIKQSNDENKEKAIENAIEDVAEWVYGSRTIGGAFLWPLEDNYSGSSDKPKPQHDFQYNRIRGGSEKGGSYIEDRVDLTLLEIKTVLETENNCLLANQYKYKKNMQRWLNHFKKEGYSAFETYVKFFCFDVDDFVDEKSNIKSIISSNLNAKRNDESNVIYEFIDEKMYGKKEIYGEGGVQHKIDDMKKMLNNVNWLINKRTEAMEEIIKNVLIKA